MYLMQNRIHETRVEISKFYCGHLAYNMEKKTSWKL
jgi:hypothetical protein